MNMANNPPETENNGHIAAPEDLDIILSMEGRRKKADDSLYSLCMIHQVQYSHIKQTKVRKSGTLLESTMAHL